MVTTSCINYTWPVLRAGQPRANTRYYPEEAGDNDAGHGLRVQLADVGDQDGPVHAAQEPRDIGVDAASLRPELDAAQRGPEVLHILDLAQDGVGDAATIEGAHAVVVDIAQRRVSADVEAGVLGNDGQR